MTILLILAAGIICPPGVITTEAGDEPVLLTLNVCDDGGPALSAGSGIPAVPVPPPSGMMPFSSDFMFSEYRQFYTFFSVTEFFRPPCL